MATSNHRLCFVCCSYLPSSSCDENCWKDDPNLIRFLGDLEEVKKVNYGARFDKNRLLKILEDNWSDEATKVDVCWQCRQLVLEAVDVRRKGREVEEVVARLQRQVVEELRKLEGCMRGYYGKMRAIEENVKRQDLKCWEKLTLIGVGRGKELENEWMLFREKIMEVVSDLGAYRNDLKRKIDVEADEESNPIKVKATRRRKKKVSDVTIKEEPNEEEDWMMNDDNYADQDYLDDFDHCTKGSDSNSGEENDTRVVTVTEKAKKVRVGSTSSTNKKQRASKKPSKKYPGNMLKLSSVDFHGMSKMKKAMVKCILFRQKIHAKISSKEDASSNNEMDLPVDLRYPLGYNKDTGNITVGTVEATLNEDRLHCPLCDFQTASGDAKQPKIIVERIYDHIAGFHLNAFQCHLCTKRLPNRRKFKVHLLLHKNTSACICNICGKPLRDPDSVPGHKWLHLNEEEKAEAIQTGKAPSSIKRKLKHQLDVGEVKTFTCDLCGKTFGTSANLKNHQKHVHSDDTVVCPKCGKSMKRLSYHIYHQKYVCPVDNFRTNQKRLHCLVCNKTYQTSSSLQMHVARTHSSDARERSHICDICGKGYKTEWDMKNHSKTHSVEKLWKCDNCGKEFNVKRNLARHKCPGGSSSGVYGNIQFDS